MLKAPTDPDEIPTEASNLLRTGVQAERFQIWTEFRLPFHGDNRSGVLS